MFKYEGSEFSFKFLRKEEGNGIVPPLLFFEILNEDNFIIGSLRVFLFRKEYTYYYGNVQPSLFLKNCCGTKIIDIYRAILELCYSIDIEELQLSCDENNKQLTGIYDCIGAKYVATSSVPNKFTGYGTKLIRNKIYVKTLK